MNERRSPATPPATIATRNTLSDTTRNRTDKGFFLTSTISTIYRVSANRRAGTGRCPVGYLAGISTLRTSFSATRIVISLRTRSHVLSSGNLPTVSQLPDPRHCA